MGYIVTAGMVTLETQVNERGGRARIDFFQGQSVPADVPNEQIEAELSLGRIGWDDGEEPEPETVESPEGEMPQGMSVAATLEWVGNDPERAKVALEAERAAGEFARATAIDRLEKIVAAADASA